MHYCATCRINRPHTQLKQTARQTSLSDMTMRLGEYAYARIVWILSIAYASGRVTTQLNEK